MASSSHRASHAPSSHVNLHCLQCDNQIGIFDNEWTRLTSSYVRPVLPGTPFGTEIAQNKTQIVPEGAPQRSLEGCTLAEVFCTKCSAVVGQYCKATPGPEQRDMLKQYLYKLSRTYLKRGDTNERVDPIFGYGGGDLLRGGGGPSTTPRLSLAPAPRWSHTPFQREESPSRLQSRSDSYLRTSVPGSMSANLEQPVHKVTAYQTSHESNSVQSAMQSAMQDACLKLQDEKLAAYDSRTLQNENQIRSMSSALEAFRQTLDSIKTSIDELRSESSVAHAEKPTDIDFIGNLHSMITAMKTAQANARELEQLRAENASLKAKWDIMQSAMATVTESSRSSSFVTSHGNSLGKRKWDGHVTHPTRNVSSSSQIPTPLSSSDSDTSHNAFDISQTTTPEQAHDKLEFHNNPVNRIRISTSATHSLGEPTLVQGNKKRRVSHVNGATNQQSPSVRFALGDGSEPPMQANPHLPNQEEQHSTLMSKEANQGLEVAEGAVGSIEEDVQLHMDDDKMAVDDNDQVMGNDDQPSAGLGNSATTADRLPAGDSVEFSDDELNRPSTSESQGAEHADPQLPQNRAVSTASVEKDLLLEDQEALPPDDASTQSAPAKRTRSRTKAASTRRMTTGSTFVKDGRSLAPEPPSSRRILPRRISHDQTGIFEHATPETVEQELLAERLAEKPKGPRQPKVYVQSTVRILNKELTELGLEEWIDKDKSDPEYKKAVEKARAEKREQTRLAALASFGVAPPGPDEAPRVSPPSLDEAFQRATEALAEVTNGQDVARKAPEKAAKAASTVASDGDDAAHDNAEKAVPAVAQSTGNGQGKRKKTKAQRDEEMRKRDELAKAAMEISD